MDLTCSPVKGARDIEFLLHRDFSVDYLNCDRMVGYAFLPEPTAFPFAPEAGTLIVRLREPAPGGPIRVRISYHGSLGIVQPWEVNRISSDWVELGLYSPWFPYLPGTRFTYCVNVSAEPHLQIVGACRAVQQNGVWNLSMDEPADDIPILAAPHFQTDTCSEGSSSVTTYCTRHRDAGAAGEMAHFTGWALNYYCNLFGDAAPKPPLSIVVAPREKGGGYARKGLIVLQVGEYRLDDPYNFKYVAHEAAHLWWTGAPTDTWEDWLNESFAEYSAMLAVKAKYGQQTFDAVLEAKRERSRGSRPIRSIERNDEDAYLVLYSQGPVLLNDLNGAIGEHASVALFRRMLREGVNTTSGFIRILAEIAGERRADEFDALLGP